MLMTPVPVFFLLGARTAAKIHMISMGFTFPPTVKTNFIVVPDVVIGIIWIVNAVTSAYARGATRYDHGRNKDCS